MRREVITFSNFLRTFLIAILVVGLSYGCKKKDDDDEDTATNTDTDPGTGTGTGSVSSNGVVFPSVGGISLANMGTSGAKLAGDDRNCEGVSGEGAGLFGLALGGACNTAPLASELMLGSTTGDFNGDGNLNCDDYTEAGEDNAGILLTLMCSEHLVKYSKIVSVAAEETAGGETMGFGVSFADYDANDSFAAVGHWTKGNSASYPANIRTWIGQSIASMAGFLTFKMDDLRNGTIYIDTSALGEMNILGEINFSSKISTADCEASPSEANCHWQELRLYPGEGVVQDGPPNGMHIKIFAEAKDDPKFIAIEGRYRYTAENAAAHFSGERGGPDISAVRDIYFTAVQKGSQLWGRFMFKDENDNYIEYRPGGAGTDDYFAPLRLTAGVCQNFGESTPVPCTDITYTDYDELWQGETAFETVPSTFTIPSVFEEGKPTAAGVVTIP